MKGGGSRLGWLRRAVQLGVLAGLFLLPLAASRWKVEAVNGSLCSLGWQGPLGNLQLTCPVGTLQTVLATGRATLDMALAVLPFLLVALVAGRLFCGWVCPQHLVGEVGERLRPAKPGRHLPDTPVETTRGRRILWVVFGAILLSALLTGVPFFCYICPVGVICRQLAGLAGFGRVGLEVVVLLAIVAAEVFLARRGWCKYLCPMGALYGWLRRPRSLAIRRHPQSCVGCSMCASVCPMGNDPLGGRVEATCTQCLTCLQACPETALSLRFGEGPEEV